MKKAYTGLKAERIDFGGYSMATSMPPTCVQIVANQVDSGSNVCNNPSETTSYMYVGDNPYGD